MAAHPKKKKKGRGQRQPMKLKDSAIAAERIAQSGFGAFGANPRVMKAQSTITRLVNQGVRINPNTSSAFTKAAVKKANSPGGRIKKLFGFRT